MNSENTRSCTYFLLIKDEGFQWDRSQLIYLNSLSIRSEIWGGSLRALSVYVSYVYQHVSHYD